MFTSLRNIFHHQGGPAIVLDLTVLPSWLEQQEDEYRQEFLRAAGDSVSRILLCFAGIRDHVLPLRTSFLFTDDGTASSAAVSALV